jgi:hypothetical protein
MSYIRNHFCSNERLAFFIVLLACFLHSCKKEFNSNNLPKNTLADTVWQPLYSSYWQEYQIDSTFFYKDKDDTTINISTSKSFQKIVIGKPIASFGIDNDFELEYWYKNDVNSPYTLQKVNRIRRENNLFILTENNLSFIKLMLPIAQDFSWNGNRMISTDAPFEFYKDWIYKYKDLNKSLTLPILFFNKTVKVEQIDDSNLIEKRYAAEWYVEQIGMVYQEIYDVKKQNPLNGWDKPENGYIVKKQIINWKK